METFESFDVQAFDANAQAEQDAKLLVKFYNKLCKDSARSDAEGRPIYREVVYISKIAPGVREPVIRPASNRDIAQFPRHYDAFKRRIDTPETGTPLREWPVIDRTLAEELAYFNIKTVEQLAEANDNAATSIMGFGKFKQKAGEWLTASKAAASAAKLEAALEQKDKDLKTMRAEMMARIDDLQAEVAKLEESKPKAKVKKG